MDIKYIIVQAGGKGSRMKRLTINKPKALVPIDNLPMLFHLFKKFPNKKYLIIGDYKFNVLTEYLNTFSTVDYRIIDARGMTGTCAGLQIALSMIPRDSAFMLIWSDLILPDDYCLPEQKENYIGISKDFSCRWKYENGLFSEERSREFGVAGHFIFKDKSLLADVPYEGELVRWMCEKGLKFTEQPLYRTKEYGLIEDVDILEKNKCRPFNKMEFYDDYVIKEPIDEQGRQLAQREINWYRMAIEHKIQCIPQIYAYSPLKLSRINGRNIYQLDADIDNKKIILKNIIDCLKSIHMIGTVDADVDSIYEAYINKTFVRLQSVYDLIPFAHNKIIVINGKECANVFYLRNKLESIMDRYIPKKFCFIHGDCTFSNLLIDDNNTPILIDPRGYFGNTELYGDPSYDWAKLYYSIVGNYDRFNLSKFDLEILDDEVTINIESNGWENLEDYYFELLKDEIDKVQMKYMLAIIYLSLTTYAWEDYDMICGAFYQGLLVLQEALDLEEKFS